MSERRENILTRCVNAQKRAKNLGVRIENCRARGARLHGGIDPGHARTLHNVEAESESCNKAAAEIHKDVDSYEYTTCEGRCHHLEARLTEGEIAIGKIEVALTHGGV